MNEENLDVYRALQEHLDKAPVGFPATESGVEIRILKQLFTTEEARITTKLSHMPEPLKKVYRKFKSDYTIEELKKMLEVMFDKGLINRGIQKKEDEEIRYYGAALFLVGFYERQLHKLTKQLVMDCREYFEEAFWMEGWNKAGIPQIRPIPVEKSLDYEQNIATYDDLRYIIENYGDPIAVQECVCRQASEVIGEPCKKTKLHETCFTFRLGAKMAIETGVGREITKEEALELLNKCQEDGLVLQPGNSQRPMNICTCCGCCCEVLVNQGKFDQPARFFNSNFYAEVDQDLCVGCGTCEDRCNMTAIKVIDDKSTVDLGRCIGCGVCAPTCPTEAIYIRKKENQIVPEKNAMAKYMAMMDKKAELARAEKL
jgi:NAD-dependent dihydropyrimidine dehydrogenase PreA subunit